MGFLFNFIYQNVCDYSALIKANFVKIVREKKYF